jgi:hypothetical protein
MWSTVRRTDACGIVPLAPTQSPSCILDPLYAPSVPELSITLLSCSIPIYHSWYPCYSSQAVLRKHSLVPPQFFATSLIHGYRFTPRYVVTLSQHYRYPPRLTEPIPLVLHPVVLQTTSLYHCRSTVASWLPPSSQSLKLSSRSYPVAVHLRRRPLHLRHESQHPSLTGVRPLERAYCHESHYISCGLKS